MFARIPGFNQPLDNFDTSQVTKMNSIFYDTGAFNQPLTNFHFDFPVINTLQMFFGDNSRPSTKIFPLGTSASSHHAQAFALAALHHLLSAVAISILVLLCARVAAT
jgi:surface protein